jgi:aldehyde dehydrogenase (NAD+)
VPSRCRPPHRPAPNRLICPLAAVGLPAAGELDTGLARINAAASGVDFYNPFGGEKASGSGPRGQGKAARDFYTSIRTVTISPGS